MPPTSSLGYQLMLVTRLAQRVPLVEQKLLTFPDHTRSSPAFSVVCGTRSLDLCVCCRLLFVVCLSSD